MRLRAGIDISPDKIKFNSTPTPFTFEGCSTPSGQPALPNVKFPWHIIAPVKIKNLLSRYLCNYLQERESAWTMMDWHSQSLDLTRRLIWGSWKITWSVVNSKIYVWLELQQVCDKISFGVLRKCIETMPERQTAAKGLLIRSNRLGSG